MTACEHHCEVMHAFSKQMTTTTRVGSQKNRISAIAEEYVHGFRLIWAYECKNNNEKKKENGDTRQVINNNNKWTLK